MAYKVHPNPQSLDTPQKIYDAVVEHLFSMKGPSLREKRKNTSCAYRSSDGENCCAVGHLIPDNVYSKNFENQSVSCLFGERDKYYFTEEAIRDFERLEEALPNLDKFIGLLSNLQNIHDSIEFWNRPDQGLNKLGITKLKRVADVHRLTQHPLVEKALAR